MDREYISVDLPFNLLLSLCLFSTLLIIRPHLRHRSKITKLAPSLRPLTSLQAVAMKFTGFLVSLASVTQVVIKFLSWLFNSTRMGQLANPKLPFELSRSSVSRHPYRATKLLSSDGKSRPALKDLCTISMVRLRMSSNTSKRLIQRTKSLKPRTWRAARLGLSHVRGALYALTFLPPTVTASKKVLVT